MKIKNFFIILAGIFLCTACSSEKQYYEGHRKGYDEGYDYGYNIGYEKGKNDTVELGKQKIENNPDIFSYDAGYNSGVYDTINALYEAGYTNISESELELIISYTSRAPVDGDCIKEDYCNGYYFDESFVPDFS